MYYNCIKLQCINDLIQQSGIATKKRKRKERIVGQIGIPINAEPQKNLFQNVSDNIVEGILEIFLFERERRRRPLHTAHTHTYASSLHHKKKYNEKRGHPPPFTASLLYPSINSIPFPSRMLHPLIPWNVDAGPPEEHNMNLEDKKNPLRYKKKKKSKKK